MQLLCFFNKIKNNFANKITLAFCFSIIFSLFFHIFYRFIYHDLSLLPSGVRLHIAQAFSYLILFLVSVWVGKQLASFNHSKDEIGQYLRFIGEDQKKIFFFKLIYSPLLIFIIFIPFWLVITHFFVSWSFFQKIVCIGSCFLFSWFCYFVFSFFLISKEKVLKPLKIEGGSRGKVLYFWRIKRLFLRRPFFCFLIFFSSLSLFALNFLFFGKFPFVLLMLLDSSFGILIGAICCVFVAEDFQSIWLERNGGVSHEDYMSSLFLLTNSLGFLGSFSITIAVFFNLIYFSRGFGFENFVSLLQLSLLAYVPSFLLNCISLQLEPRNLPMQLTLLFITSFFLCTAVMINPLLSLLCPFLFLYGRDSQRDRFYNI